MESTRVEASSGGLVETARKMSLVIDMARSVASGVTGEDDASNDLQVSANALREQSAILELRQMLADLKDREQLDDGFLRKCLTQNKWKGEASATVARGFVSFRRSLNWPFRIPPLEVATALRTGMHWLLPPKHRDDEEGPAACLVYNAAKLDPSVCPIEEYQKMGTFLMECATDSFACQSQGVALVVDCANVEVGSMLRIMALQDIRRGVLMWKGAFPCRLRLIWVIDPPPGAATLSSGVLKLLAPKIRERIHFAWRSGGEGLAPLTQDLGRFFVLPPSLGGPEASRPDAPVFDWDTEASRLLREEFHLAPTEERTETRSHFDRPPCTVPILEGNLHGEPDSKKDIFIL